jgi:hypothetical protein
MKEENTINLNDILPLDELTKNGKVLLVRHYHKDITEMLQRGLIDEYQSYQHQPAFTKVKYMVSFIRGERNTAVFFGVFEIKEILFDEDLPKLSSELAPYCNEQVVGKDFYLKLRRVDDLNKFKDRVVIDWRVPRGWYSYYNPEKQKPVIRVLPANYVFEFPGLMNVNLDYAYLEKIINNKDSNERWYNALSNLQAIYLILHKKAGYQYVGSAYGKEGLWQRWRSYTQNDHTGGNLKLKGLKRKYPGFYKDFQFSILEVLSKTVNKDYCIRKEGMWKEKLGSRANGLNIN